jgi:5-hydroxyisourate hydrolase
MAGKLTTHVLDTMHGRPGAGLGLELARLDAAGGRQLLVRTVTDADGRCAAPLLAGAAMLGGRYELAFAVGDYFRGLGVRLAEPPFLDVVPVRFAIADPTAHHHVPLLVSPYGYTTYRGS